MAHCRKDRSSAGCQPRISMLRCRSSASMRATNEFSSSKIHLRTDHHRHQLALSPLERLARDQSMDEGRTAPFRAKRRDLPDR